MKANKLKGKGVSVFCLRMVGEQYDMMSGQQVKDMHAVLQSQTGQMQIFSDNNVDEICFNLFPPTFAKDEQLIADFHKMKHKIMDFARANKWPSFFFELYILNPRRAVEAFEWQSLHGRWDVIASEAAMDEPDNRSWGEEVKS